MSRGAATTSGSAHSRVTPRASTPARVTAVYLRDPESGIIFLAEKPRLEDMAAFVDAEYEAGVYRDYVNARELKLATMRRRMPVISRCTPVAHGCSTSAARRVSSSKLRSRRVSIRRGSSFRRWPSSWHNRRFRHASPVATSTRCSPPILGSSTSSPPSTSSSTPSTRRRSSTTSDAFGPGRLAGPEHARYRALAAPRDAE